MKKSYSSPHKITKRQNLPANFGKCPVLYLIDRGKNNAKIDKIKMLVKFSTNCSRISFLLNFSG